MPIAFWVSVLVLVGCTTTTAQDSVALPNRGTLGYTVSGTKTGFQIHTDDQSPYELIAVRDDTVSAQAAPTKVDVIGAIQGIAIILVDTYASKPGGMSYCQAGEERFLRIISIAHRPARETLRIKLESCRETIELATPGVEWEPNHSLLKIHWLQGPHIEGEGQTRTIRIDAEGKPK